jgi:hypothetical protein
MRSRRSRPALAVAATVAGVAVAFALTACASNTSASNTGGGQASPSQASGAGQSSARPRGPAGFAWFGARPTPDGWQDVSLPNGTAVLAYPRSMHALMSDRGTVSEGLTAKSGTLLVYLNVTPKQGNETLRDWPGFRVGHLLDDDATGARITGHATGLAFRGGLGSCVLDAYTTKVHANHYREIACFIQGSRGASVLVAATPAADWGTYAGLLEEAVNAYAVR